MHRKGPPSGEMTRCVVFALERGRHLFPSSSFFSSLAFIRRHVGPVGDTDRCSPRLSAHFRLSHTASRATCKLDVKRERRKSHETQI